mgnify:CR=1 FL=1
MKRFTDTDIWDKEWFMKLSPKHKCLLRFIFDKCDAAGVWTPNWVLASAYVNDTNPCSSEDLDQLTEQIEFLPNGKVFIPEFIMFQYGKLSKDCKPHIPVYRLLQKHGIDINAIKMSEDIGKTHNVSDLLRKRIFEEDGFVCCYCGKEKEVRNLTIDHVVSRKRGGTDKADNLVASCLPCNIKKSDLSVEEFCSKYNLDFPSISERIAVRLSERLPERVSDTLKEKEKEKEQDKEEDNNEGGYRGKHSRKPNIKPEGKKDTELKNQYKEFVEEVKKMPDNAQKKIAIASFINDHKPNFIEPYADLWNLSTSVYGIASLATISEGRVKKFKTRVREPDFDFVKILQEIRNSHYLQGKKTDWKIDWDWLFENDTNYLKVIEGKYRNTSN